MDNPEKLAIVGTQDTGRRQTKQKTQHINQKQNEPHKKPLVNPGVCERSAVPASYKTPTMLLI